jgi:hypothetical protein
MKKNNRLSKLLLETVSSDKTVHKARDYMAKVIFVA